MNKVKLNFQGKEKQVFHVARKTQFILKLKLL